MLKTYSWIFQKKSNFSNFVVTKNERLQSSRHKDENVKLVHNFTSVQQPTCKSEQNKFKINQPITTKNKSVFWLLEKIRVCSGSWACFMIKVEVISINIMNNPISTYVFFFNLLLQEIKGGKILDNIFIFIRLEMTQ